jgi:ubiquitin carboxyl-terminal hydrolase 4/11/15
VTCIPVDSTRKVDVDAAVSAVLAPFVRAKVHPPGDSMLNGSGPSLDGIVLTDNGASCEKGLSTSNVDEAITDAELLPFNLYLSDDKGHVRNPIDEDSNHVLGAIMRLLMGWSVREYEIYNLKYMEDLPDVFKPGFMSKKTRQEAVNLFSCLDAFLKDEPLGPDDMWLVYFLLFYLTTVTDLQFLMASTAALHLQQVLS